LETETEPYLERIFLVKVSEYGFHGGLQMTEFIAFHHRARDIQYENGVFRQ